MIFSLEELGVDPSEVGVVLCGAGSPEPRVSEGGDTLDGSEETSTGGLERLSGFFCGGLCLLSEWWYSRDFCKSISSLLI